MLLPMVSGHALSKPAALDGTPPRSTLFGVLLFFLPQGVNGVRGESTEMEVEAPRQVLGPGDQCLPSHLPLPPCEPITSSSYIPGFEPEGTRQGSQRRSQPRCALAALSSRQGRLCSLCHRPLRARGRPKPESPRSRNASRGAGSVSRGACEPQLRSVQV